MIYASFRYFIALDIPFSKLYTFRSAPSNQRQSINFIYLAPVQFLLLLTMVMKFPFNCCSVVTLNICHN